MNESTGIDLFITKDVIDLSHTLAGSYLAEFKYPWEIIPEIKKYLPKIASMLDRDAYYTIGNDVWIAKSAIISPSAFICGPAIIGERSELRHCAYIRENVIIGDDCVIGNSCEIKNSIISDGAQIPHYNYVGDSVLGYKSHMGAGSIASNLRLDKKHIIIRCGKDSVETGLRKMGTVLGDFSEIGCGCVIYPGTVIGKNCLIYPLTGVRGAVPSNTVVKSDGNMTKRKNT